jgi:branched-chain amino acid transport system substrate-binding protein
MRPIPALLILVAALALVAGCESESSTGPRTAAPTPPPPPEPALLLESGQPVLVGVSAALSGDQSALGEDIADAVDLAVEDYAGTIKGHPIRTMRLDDGCTDPEMAVAVARRLLQAGVAGVVGPMCTTGAQAANKVYEAALVAHLSPAATRIDLSEQGERFFFRTAWRDDVLAGIQASYAQDDLDAETALVIDDGDPYGKTLADAFVTIFEDSGGAVVERERITRGDTDFSTLARLARSASPDVAVFAGLDPEGGLVLKALREEGFGGVFIGPDSLLAARDFATNAGSAAEGAVLVGGPMPDEAFANRFLERFGRRPSTPFVLQAYDATRILLQSIQLVAVEDASGALTIDREALSSAMHSAEYLGLTGTVSFDDKGDREGDTPVAAGLRLYRFDGARFVTVD